MSCPLCEKVEKTQHPYLIKELVHSKWYLGDHQYFPGYTVLVSKHHIKEMTELSRKERGEFFEELMWVQEIVEKTFKPDKINLSSLGNVVPHVHWHLFARFKSEDCFSYPVWRQMDKFAEKKISNEEASSIIQKIQRVITSSKAF